MVNFIYFMRARTEERHLCWDADYVAYARYIEKRGLFAFIGRWLPLLRFRSGHLFNIDSRAGERVSEDGELFGLAPQTEIKS